MIICENSHSFLFCLTKNSENFCAYFALTTIFSLNMVILGQLNTITMTDLTPKQEKFCQVFFNTGNATYAYKKVYDCKKMKADSLRNTAKNLKNHPKIQARLKELQEQYERESSVDRKRIEQVLVDIVTSMDSDLYDIDGGDKVKMRAPIDLPKRTKNAIQRIRNDNGRIEIVFNNKIEAARLLGRWNGWEKPIEVENRHSGNIGGELSIIPNGFDNLYTDDDEAESNLDEL